MEESFTWSLMATCLLLDFGPDVLCLMGVFAGISFFFFKGKSHKTCARSLQCGTIKAHLILSDHQDQQNKGNSCIKKRPLPFQSERGHSFQWSRVARWTPEIEAVCKTSFHTCNHIVLTYYNSPPVDPGLLCSCWPTSDTTQHSGSH